jgi:hypothetical protein
MGSYVRLNSGRKFGIDELDSPHPPTMTRDACRWRGEARYAVRTEQVYGLSYDFCELGKGGGRG